MANAACDEATHALMGMHACGRGEHVGDVPHAWDTHDA